MSAKEQIAILQGFVNSYTDDISAVQTVLNGPGLSEAAQLPLIGALNYVLDMLDIFPDHYQGLGVADDAAILRVAAAESVKEGASDAAIRRLATEMTAVQQVFGDLTEPLERFVRLLPEREVRGRKAAQITASKDTRALFNGDVTRQIAAHKPQTIEGTSGSPEWLMSELRMMTKSALKKAGVLDK